MTTTQLEPKRRRGRPPGTGGHKNVPRSDGPQEQMHLTLSKSLKDKVRKVAVRERRSVASQAIVLIEQALAGEA